MACAFVSLTVSDPGHVQAQAAAMATPPSSSGRWGLLMDAFKLLDDGDAVTAAAGAADERQGSSSSLRGEPRTPTTTATASVADGSPASTWDLKPLASRHNSSSSRSGAVFDRVSPHDTFVLQYIPTPSGPAAASSASWASGILDGDRSSRLAEGDEAGAAPALCLGVARDKRSVYFTRRCDEQSSLWSIARPRARADDSASASDARSSDGGGGETRGHDNDGAASSSADQPRHAPIRRAADGSGEADAAPGPAEAEAEVSSRQLQPHGRAAVVADEGQLEHFATGLCLQRPAQRPRKHRGDNDPDERDADDAAPTAPSGDAALRLVKCRGRRRTVAAAAAVALRPALRGESDANDEREGGGRAVKGFYWGRLTEAAREAERAARQLWVLRRAQSQTAPASSPSRNEGWGARLVRRITGGAGAPGSNAAGDAGAGSKIAASATWLGLGLGLGSALG